MVGCRKRVAASRRAEATRGAERTEHESERMQSMKSAPWKSLGMFVLALGVWAAPARAAEEAVPTFTKDVAPIFQAKCEACHRPGSIAPMSLVTYQEARPWARSIKDSRGGPADASVACRPHRRDSGVQERPVADRRGDRHGRALGRRRRAARQPRGHAGRGRLARRVEVVLRRAVRRAARPESSSRRPSRWRPRRTTRGGSRGRRPG